MTRSLPYPHLRWFGTSCGFLGALTLALNIEVSGWGFVVFMGNSLAWGYVAARINDRALFAQNVAWTITNAVGIVRWLW